jgi:4'-phosphopantetheinyl transferase
MDSTLVWLLDAGALTDGVLAAYTSWLSESERERVGRFVRPARKRQFIAGRALLRLALARVLGIAPQDVSLLDRPGQAPMLTRPACTQVGFSISHSGPWVGCAVSDAGRVGFDIELIDPERDIHALADQAFDEQQRAWLASRPRESRVRDFYSLWSAAEARFKLGVAPVSTFEFPHPALSVVLCCEREPARAPGLEVVSHLP